MPALSRTDITDAAAARFLQQAQFSSTLPEIEAVQRLGYDGWLEAAFEAPRGMGGCDWLDSQGYNAITPKGEYFWPQMGDYMAWNQMLARPDQLRVRTSFALSQYFVVSLDAIDGFWPPYMIGAYWDLLNTHTFGNFRDLLEAVSLNAAMGLYLNTKGNLKEEPASGRRPDENYAREIMQLFTIGLYELNPDGTLKRGPDGDPIETYTQDDIVNLARVFTGYDYDYSNTKRTDVEWLTYPVPDTQFAKDPMAFDPAKHSTLPVDFLGLSIPAATSGKVAFRAAHDHLFRHPNVGPFFGRQMIQRLVTSDPSPDYVGRVAAAFDDNGQGVRGDMKAVWRAVLLDPEARAMPGTRGAHAGRLREPVVRVAQGARTIDTRSEDGKYIIHQTGRDDRGIAQSPLRPPSVFNYYRPGYIPPQTEMAERGVTAPEFQIHNETSTAGYINTLQWFLRWGYNDVKPSYEALRPLAPDVGALIDRLDLELTARQLTEDTKAAMQQGLSAFGVTADSDEEAVTSLLAAATLMVMASPDYLIQK